MMGIKHNVNKKNMPNNAKNLENKLYLQNNKNNISKYDHDIKPIMESGYFFKILSKEVSYFENLTKLFITAKFWITLRSRILKQIETDVLAEVWVSLFLFVVYSILFFCINC